MWLTYMGPWPMKGDGKMALVDTLRDRGIQVYPDAFGIRLDRKTEGKPSNEIPIPSKDSVVVCLFRNLFLSLIPDKLFRPEYCAFIRGCCFWFLARNFCGQG